MDWLTEWLPTLRTCGVLIGWTFIVFILANAIEAVLGRR